MLILFLVTSIFFQLPLSAMEAGEQLPDHAQEKRALALGQQLRCVVCQAESINDSPAGLAQDLRKLVREKIKAGLDDAQILEFIHERYGDYVLLRPPVKQATLPLWLAPWAFLAFGFAMFGWVHWRNHNQRKG